MVIKKWKKKDSLEQLILWSAIALIFEYTRHNEIKDSGVCPQS